MRVVKAYKNVGVSRATSPKRQKKKSSMACRDAGLTQAYVDREGSAGESRAAPTDSTPRRERRDEAAGTRCLSRPRRSDWSRAAIGKRAGCRSLAGKEWGQSGGFARCTGEKRAAAAASRGSSMAAASPANGRWRHCEAERGVADYACGQSEAHRMVGAEGEQRVA